MAIPDLCRQVQGRTLSERQVPMDDAPMSAQPISSLAVPYLGVLASLQLIDPAVANTTLLKADQI